MTRLEVLWRVAAHAATRSERFVLRGSLVLAHWLVPHPRPVDDVDFLILTDDLEGVRDAAKVFGDVDWEVTWAETPFPGLRGTVRLPETKTEADPDPDQDQDPDQDPDPDPNPNTVRVDLGFGDPMHLPPVPLPTPHGPIRAVAPEVLFAWKVHGLFEHGPGKWRAKDLLDAVMMLRHVELQRDALPHTLRDAFVSRGTPLSSTARFFAEEFGQSRGSRRKWRAFRKRRPDAPDDFLALADELRAPLAPLFAALQRTE